MELNYGRRERVHINRAVSMLQQQWNWSDAHKFLLYLTSRCFQYKYCCCEINEHQLAPLHGKMKRCGNWLWYHSSISCSRTAASFAYAFDQFGMTSPVMPGWQGHVNSHLFMVAVEKCSPPEKLFQKLRLHSAYELVPGCTFIASPKERCWEMSLKSQAQSISGLNSTAGPDTSEITGYHLSLC